MYFILFYYFEIIKNFFRISEKIKMILHRQYSPFYSVKIWLLSLDGLKLQYSPNGSYTQV